MDMVKHDGKVYEKVECYAGCTIERAVEILKEYNNNTGILGYINFNTHILYSDTVTVDGAYIEILGKTKDEYDAEQKRHIEEQKKREEEFQAKIPEMTKQWIEKGHNVLDKKYWKLWDKCVPIRLRDLYHGMELRCCLDIVKILNENGDIKSAKKEIENQDHSGMSFGLVRSMVRSFCDRGEEFCEAVKY